MKKVLLVALATSALISCTQQKPFEKTIVTYLNDNAMGFDIKPKVNEVAVVDTVTVQESINEWYELNHNDEYPKDSAETNVLKLIQLYKEGNKYGEDDNKIKIWEAKLARLRELKSKTGVDYYVVQANYTINNPVVKAEQKLDRVFLVASDKIIAEATPEQLIEYSKNSKQPHLKYEIVMYNGK